MGIISDLFGLNRNQAPIPPVMVSVLPSAAITTIRSGMLPQLNTQSLLLEKGELCRFVDKACLVTENTITRYEGNRDGFSVRVIKGLTYHTGRTRINPIREKIPVYTPGYLYITDKRIVFVAKENGFEKKVSGVTAVTPYSDAIGIQFGSKTYNLLLPVPDVAVSTLHMVK
jgi:hypothetical protein